MPSRPFTILSSDSAFINAARSAAESAGDALVSIHVIESLDALASSDGVDGLVLADPAFCGALSVHEWALGFLRNNRALLFLGTHGSADDADGLARFVGAQGAVSLPLDVAAFSERLSSPFGTPRNVKPDLPDAADAADLGASLGGRLNTDDGTPREGFLASVTDSVTGLFSAQFWDHRLDEEFKRSMRFRSPLGLVRIAFDGEANDDVLLEVASVILLDTRDVDVVAHHGHNTYMALLPHTGPEGTRVFGQRVKEALDAEGMTDVMGDPLDWSVDTACCPDTAYAGSRDFLAQVSNG
ncbi:MAG: hypothetical protein HN405_00740 [Planctomycetes bacterium]|jgi:GGDEF domain-containing protein|nr:hypothetical protein [Planctomycetota bacterium]MBT4028809.1 hypothetical protein [Planctomycetota bacterium]MBT4559631.1 hypothetical protein [Planctomycetota bacterium]MBT7012912.1 hypothetical protein [Planctomycetota bacterium]MBT7317991.1 hypothetical protein [Planctomycetota bacterium]